MRKKQCGIYLITGPQGRCYVGQSIGIETRWAEHRRDMKRQETVNPDLSGDYALHGGGAFEFKVLTECDECFLDQEEQMYLKALKPFYNIHEDVVGGTKTAESRAKISKALTGKKHPERSPEWKARKSAAISASNMGRVHSEEHKAKLSKAHTGKVMGPMSAEHRKKHSEALKGKKKSPEHVAKMRGRKNTPETCAKISAAMTGKIGRVHSEETKRDMAEKKKRWWVERKLAKQEALGHIDKQD
jgi:group I intron endonuclease